jgi:MSHA biogenesis protein MshK
MVKPLSSYMMSNVICSALLMLLAFAAHGAYAEQFVDPTRPPEAAGFAQQGNRDVASAPALQSVLISPQRRLAIINGKTVKVGEKFGTSRVVSITETEVVLQNGKDLKTLKLFPDVQKRLTSNAVGNKADHRR